MQNQAAEAHELAKFVIQQRLAAVPSLSNIVGKHGLETVQDNGRQIAARCIGLNGGGCNGRGDEDHRLHGRRMDCRFKGILNRCS